MIEDYNDDNEGIFEPESDLDEHSKASYLEHISKRLSLPESLKCTKGSGLLNSNELRIMAGAIINFIKDINVNNPKERSVFLEDLREDMKGRSDFSFVTKKEWDKFSKTQLGMIIAATLNFQFEGDPHIGQHNGNLYIRFYENIYDKLPDPDESLNEVMEMNRESVNDFSIKRNKDSSKKEKMTALELSDLLGLEDKDGITVPEYQRSDQQWPSSKKEEMIRSMIRDIPMPSIILGKTDERPDDPWQLVDGHQRLSTVRKFFDELHDDHFTFMGSEYHDLPDFIREKFDGYKFVMEWVVAKDDKALAQLYTLYNNSGKKMTPVQIRVAKWHEISALHHLLLALAGGPILAEREISKERMGISDSILEASQRASALRRLLPGRGAPSDDEKLQLRQVTEKTYDNYCKTIAYCLYRQSLDRTNETPTAEAAVSHIFSQSKNYRPGKAHSIVKQLDFVIRNIATIYGDYAFLTHRSISAEDEQGNPTTTYEIGKALNSWAMQVQAGGLWGLNDNEMTLLNHYPDDFQNAWKKFNIKEMVDIRQNSKTLWKAQEKWTNKVKDLVSEYRIRDFKNDESQTKNHLVGLSKVLRDLNGQETRDDFIDALRHSYNEFEVTFIINNSQLKDEKD